MQGACCAAGAVCRHFCPRPACRPHAGWDDRLGGMVRTRRVHAPRLPARLPRPRLPPRPADAVRRRAARTGGLFRAFGSLRVAPSHKPDSSAAASRPAGRPFLERKPAADARADEKRRAVHCPAPHSAPCSLRPSPHPRRRGPHCPAPAVLSVRRPIGRPPVIWSMPDDDPAAHACGPATARDRCRTWRRLGRLGRGSGTPCVLARPLQSEAGFSLGPERGLLPHHRLHAPLPSLRVRCAEPRKEYTPQRAGARMPTTGGRARNGPSSCRARVRLQGSPAAG